MAVNRDAHNLHGFLMAHTCIDSATHALSNPVHFTAHCVRIYLSSTHIELSLRLVKIVLNAIVHHWIHFLNKCWIPLPVTNLVSKKFVRNRFCTRRLHLDCLSSCKVLLISDHRALLSNTLRNVIEEHIRIVLLVLISTLAVLAVLTTILLVKVLYVLQVLLVVLFVHKQFLLGAGIGLLATWIELL